MVFGSRCIGNLYIEPLIELILSGRYSAVIHHRTHSTWELLRIFMPKKFAQSSWTKIFCLTIFPSAFVSLQGTEAFAIEENWGDFFVNQTLEKNRFYYAESSHLRLPLPPISVICYVVFVLKSAICPGTLGQKEIVSENVYVKISWDSHFKVNKVLFVSVLLTPL